LPENIGKKLPSTSIPKSSHLFSEHEDVLLCGREQGEHEPVDERVEPGFHLPTGAKVSADILIFVPGYEVRTWV
jgi:hypothetical protein